MYNRFQFYIKEKPQNVNLQCSTTEEGEIIMISLHLECETTQVFDKVTFGITVPGCEVHKIWHPKIHLIKALNLDWFQNLNKTNGFTGAPVQCLVGGRDQNCGTLGISDTLNTFDFQVIPVEETGEYDFSISFFGEDAVERKSYDVTLRLDLRDLPYYEVLDDMSAWWEEAPENAPLLVPEEAKKPMYSTWYSYHQKVEAETLLEQCRLSKELGCGTLLLDDGWQTEDKNRGYAYCGDWEPAPGKFPDMAEFVREVHGLGMKVIPWYSLPFMGEKSRNYAQFQDMLIDPDSPRQWHVLDPRYPKVREFIISLFERALEEWDVDGFKMDFIDEFVVTPFSGIQEDPRRDFISFYEATDCLMRECIRRLRRRKPDILLEFRQTYNGPRMRTYGNIFRAVDCPFDAVENRVRVTDIRLLCRDSAVHSDMLMWHPEDTPESAALQFINILFSVPQISVRLEELSADHRSMLEFYCGLWNHYRDALIGGVFEPLHPDSLYSIIRGYHKEQFVCVSHGAAVIPLEHLFMDMLLVNGSSQEKLYLDNTGGCRTYEISCYDCMGNLLWKDLRELRENMIYFVVPAGGVLRMRRR